MTEKNATTKTGNVLIIYHSDKHKCLDGFTSAWIMHNACVDSGGFAPGRIALQGMSYAPHDVANLLSYLKTKRYNHYERIIIVDYSLSLADLEQICAFTGANILVLDHHKTAFKAYDEDFTDEDFDSYAKLTRSYFNSQVTVHLDNSKSGAGICWDCTVKIAMPWLVKYVQDYDLWQFKYLETTAIHEVLQLEPQTIKNWCFLAIAMEEEQTIKRMVEKGNKLLEEKKKVLQEIAASATACELLGTRGLAVECDPKYTNEVCHLLAQASNTYGAVISYETDKSKYKFSLRAEDKCDVSVIAESLGGGGHKNAASFYISMQEFLLDNLNGGDSRKVTKPTIKEAKKLPEQAPADSEHFACKRCGWRMKPNYHRTVMVMGLPFRRVVSCPSCASTQGWDRIGRNRDTVNIPQQKEQKSHE